MIATAMTQATLTPAITARTRTHRETPRDV
jgi:hypothetical protein